MTNTNIYCLFDANGTPFYIGKSNNVGKRLSVHKTCCKKGGRLLYNRFPNSFTADILDVVDIKDWDFWERHYISLYRFWGFKMLNTHDGGDLFLNPKKGIKTLKVKRKYNIYKRDSICYCYWCAKPIISIKDKQFCSKKCESNIIYQI